MQASPEKLFCKILATIGVSKKDQKKIFQVYQNLLLANMLDGIKNELSENQQIELDKELLKSKDWVKIATKYASQVDNGKRLSNAISKRLQETTEQFIGILSKECPASQRQEVLEYALELILLK